MTPQSPRRPAPPPDPSSRPPSPKGGFLGGLTKVLMLTIVLVLVILPFTPYASKIKRAIADIAHGRATVREVIRKVEVPKVVERRVVERVEVPAAPPAAISSFVPKKDVAVGDLFNGIKINTTLNSVQGTYASLEKLDPAAYQVRFEVDIRVPKANQNVQELSRINPDLPQALAGLGAMLPTSRVSPYYHQLYDSKLRSIKQDLTHLAKVLDRHNYFDTETILELTHPTTSRKALLIQSEMDVVADGTDGDRQSDQDAEIYQSDYYQPFTSYAWAKKTSTPNPLLSRWETRLKEAKAAYAVKGLSKDKNAQLASTVKTLTAEIVDMKKRSSLIADTDPFIVLSLLFRNYQGTEGYTPQMGDYAVVIHGKQILPAICGDYGPGVKMGEASLRIAKQVNPKATPYVRGEDDLKVTYLIFPGTAVKPNSPPDLTEWRKQCQHLIDELGGLGDGYKLHEWFDLVKWRNEFVGPPWPPPKKR